MNRSNGLLISEHEVNRLQNGCLTARLAAGDFIKDILFSQECKSLQVILKEDENIHNVVEKLSKYGLSISDIFELDKNFKVTFNNAKSAKKTFYAFKNEKTFTLKQYTNWSLNSKKFWFKLIITFLRRPCLGKACM